MRRCLGAVLVAGFAACDGGSPANVSPAATLAVTPQGVVIAGVTIVTFSAAAVDPDGDAVSYVWNLGDGTTSSAASLTHVYQGEGTFPVILTVRDGRGGTATAGSSVTTRSLNGRWLLSEGGQRFYERGYDLIQTGARLGGYPFSEPDKHCLGEISGLLTSPRTLSFQFVGCDGELVVIGGILTESLLTAAGTYTHPSGPPQAINLTRP